MHIPLTYEFMHYALSGNTSEVFPLQLSPASAGLDTGALLLCFQAVTVSKALVVSACVLLTLQPFSGRTSQKHYADECV